MDLVSSRKQPWDSASRRSGGRALNVYMHVYYYGREKLKTCGVPAVDF